MGVVNFDLDEKLIILDLGILSADGSRLFFLPVALDTGAKGHGRSFSIDEYYLFSIPSKTPSVIPRQIGLIQRGACIR